jgi:hypothetical protein
MNAALVKELPKLNHCQLYHDDDGNKLCIKLVTSDAEYAQTIGPVNKGGARKLVRRAFFLEFGILPEKTIKLPAHYDSSKRMITVRLPEERKG